MRKKFAFKNIVYEQIEGDVPNSVYMLNNSGVLYGRDIGARFETVYESVYYEIEKYVFMREKNFFVHE